MVRGATVAVNNTATTHMVATEVDMVTTVANHTEVPTAEVTVEASKCNKDLKATQMRGLSSSATLALTLRNLKLEMFSERTD